MSHAVGGFASGGTPTEEAGADARLDGWKKLREALSVRAEKEQAWLDVQKNRKTLQDDCRKQQQTVAQLKAQAEVCRKEKEEVQQVYDKQRMSCEDWAREARARLSKGDVCPVCGKEVGDDLKSEVHFVSLLEPVRALLEEKGTTGGGSLDRTGTGGSGGSLPDAAGRNGGEERDYCKRSLFSGGKDRDRYAALCYGEGSG